MRTVVTAGINPFFQTREEIAGEIRDALLPALKGERIDAIYFYGAGCAFPEKNRIVEEAITPYIPAPIEVYSDLMAAARALCGSVRESPVYWGRDRILVCMTGRR